MEFPFFQSRYIRLRPGQEKTDTVCLELPIVQIRLFEYLRANAEFAKRLVVEVGYYDEDLPGLILHIIDINNKLNCDNNDVSFDVNDSDVLDRFFPGWRVAQALNFDSTYVTSQSDEMIIIPYMEQVLNGEKSLWIEIDGLSIPLE